MAKLTLVLGGIKSGKSLFAENLVEQSCRENGWNGCDVVYLATAEVRDDEMRERVLRHRERRPKAWLTVESPLKPEDVISGLDGNVRVAIVDCITIYLTNMLLQYDTSCYEPAIDGGDILRCVEGLCETGRVADVDVIMVSNEVGNCIVPENRLARLFADLAGKANQIIAREADDVYLVTAGIAQKLK